MTVFEKFEYIVNDPFYSPSQGGEVLVDDMNRVFVDDEYEFTISWDEEIDELYEEWSTYQSAVGAE